MHDRTSPFEPFLPRRLYRDPERGRIAGVCAGLAEYLSVDPFLIRLAVVTAMVMTMPFGLVAYVVAVLALPVRPARPLPGIGEPERAAAPPVGRTLAEVRERLRDCGKRVEKLEAYVASSEYELNRAIRDLDRR